MSSNVKNKPAPQPHWVSSDDALAELCTRVYEAGQFAFDAEFVGEDAFEAQLCLVQVATERDVWLVDPMDGLDLTPFWTLVADEQVETIVHAGMEDISYCRKAVGKPAARVFDVQIAAGLVTPDFPMSLQKLCKQFLNVRLHKSQTLSNWRTRPLAAEQVRYAVEDVWYLNRLHADLRRRLRRLGREAWLREDCDRMCACDDQTAADGTRKNPARRVKGAGGLRGRAQAILIELVEARNALAAQMNRPAKAILKDYLLVAIAKSGLDQPAALTKLRGFHLNETARRELCDAVRRGKQRPIERNNDADDREETPVEVGLGKLLAAILYDYCRVQNIAFKLLATNRDVRAVVRAHMRPDSEPVDPAEPGALSGGWRREAVGNMLADVLTGRSTVRVDPREHRIIVDARRAT